jgi:hypothetical protein
MWGSSSHPGILFRDEYPGSFGVEWGNVSSPLTEFNVGVEILTDFEYYFLAFYTPLCPLNYCNGA